MRNFREYGLYPLLIIVAAVTIYHQVVNNEFTGLDDYLIIEENWDKLHDVRHIYTAFTDDVYLSEHGSYYRPMLLISYMPDVFFSETNKPTPNIFFVFNILLLAVSGILVYFFLKEFGFDITYRLLFVLLYIAHPALTPAVAWIPGRNDLILLLFTIPSIWSFIRYLKTKNTIWLVVHLLFFALSLFSKETAVVIPLITMLMVLFFEPFSLHNMSYSYFDIISIYEVCKEGCFRLFGWLKNNIVLVFGWVVVFTGWLVLRDMALSDSPFTFLGLAWQLATAWIELIVMFGVILFPYNLPVYMDVSIYRVIIAIPATLTLFYVIYRIKPRPKFFFLGVFWFLLFSLPSTLSDLVIFHRLIMPMIGFAFLFEPINLNQLFHGKRITIIVCAIIFSLFAFENANFQREFSDAKTFWLNAKNNSPHNAMAHNGMAWYYHNVKQNDSAYYYYQKVIELDPFKEHARLGMAIIEEEKGNTLLADSLLQEELKVTLDSHFVYYYIGQIRLERGDTNGALSYLSMGYPVTVYSLNARIYYDTLCFDVKSKLSIDIN